MPLQTLNSHTVLNTENEYADSLEYLQDELHYLDLLLYMQVLTSRERKPADPLDQLKGLVLSQEEVTGLLRANPPANTDETYFHTLSADLQALRTTIDKRRAASIEKGTYLSLDRLSRLFNLTFFEEQCILLCLAVEMDTKYEKIYAFLQDDITRKKPTVDLLLKLLCRGTAEKAAARLAFDSGAPLAKYILQVGENAHEAPAPLLSRFLKLEDRLVSFLLDIEYTDDRIVWMTRLISPQTGPARLLLSQELQTRIQKYLESRFSQTRRPGQNIIFYFYGAAGSGKKTQAEIICKDLNVPMLVVDTRKFPDDRTSFKQALLLLGREAVLRQGLLCFENFDSLFDEEDRFRMKLRLFFDTIKAFSPLTLLSGSRRLSLQEFTGEYVYIDMEFPVPPDNLRKDLWESFVREYAIDPGIDLGALAGKFKFTPGQIRNALNAAKDLAQWRGSAHITGDDLYAACHAQCTGTMGTLAQKIQPKYTWDDIVLPPDQLNQLKEICTQVKYRHVVYGSWGFDRKISRGKGLNILFSGPPGTGKTMAAEVIAGELRLELYKIDLSQVISKYIGETEKNLQMVFEAARTSHAIIFFDEADAFFGKRSEVKDAHDRHANIEIAYLLQKMEEYEGVTILATNLRNNMDEAFTRRLQFSIEFPFPDMEYRRKIWRTMFPGEAPKGGDIDFNFLADKFQIAGGNIKNVVLAAAFFAAEKQEPIGMEHLIRATKRELQKMGRICMKEDFGEYYRFIS